MSKNELIIGGVKVLPGQRKKLSVAVAKLYDLTPMEMSVEVIRGREAGPTLFVSSTIHGDEINGVEIISKLLQRKELKNIKGSLIVVPIVNIFGFNSKTRYLPDRRDLNRSFPGSANGSLTAQLAHVFVKEIISKCTHGIDLHSAAIHRKNLPQVRVTCGEGSSLEQIAKSFGAPVVINSQSQKGTLRSIMDSHKISYVLYEGGEALRFDPFVTKVGLNGVLNVMKHIGMLPKYKSKTKKTKSFFATNTYWMRANHSGIFQTDIEVGQKVHKGEIAGYITDPFGEIHEKLLVEKSGIIICKAALPLVNRGDAIFHVACFKDIESAYKTVSSFIIDDAIDDSSIQS